MVSSGVILMSSWPKAPIRHTCGSKRFGPKDRAYRSRRSGLVEQIVAERGRTRSAGRERDASRCCSADKNDVQLTTDVATEAKCVSPDGIRDGVLELIQILNTALREVGVVAQSGDCSRLPPKPDERRGKRSGLAFVSSVGANWKSIRVSAARNSFSRWGVKM